MKTIILAAMAFVVLAAAAAAPVQAAGNRKAAPHFKPWCKVGHPVAGCLVRPHDSSRLAALAG